MKLFLNDGHLSEEALMSLEKGTLREEERLKVAEHLSVCDSCLLQYSLFLTEEHCLSPGMPLVPAVMNKIRRRMVTLFTSRYAVAAASVLLALALWTTGLFSALVPDRTFSSQEEEKEPAFSVLTAVSTSIDNFFNSITQELAKGWEPLDISSVSQQPSTSKGE